MSKRISVLGSTGSIGRQSLEVIAAGGMEVAALTANSSVKLMEEQVRQFHPELAVLMDEKEDSVYQKRHRLRKFLETSNLTHKDLFLLLLSK